MICKNSIFKLFKRNYMPRDQLVSSKLVETSLIILNSLVLISLIIVLLMLILIRPLVDWFTIHEQLLELSFFMSPVFFASIIGVIKENRIIMTATGTIHLISLLILLMNNTSKFISLYLFIIIILSFTFSAMLIERQRQQQISHQSQPSDHTLDPNSRESNTLSMTTSLRQFMGACLEKKRLSDLEKAQKKQLQELNAALEVRNRFIRQTFGRYLSDEIVETILEKPEGLKIGGEKRQATVLMADLRGFTSLSERLPAEDVVSMVNIYLETMTEIILKFQGTIEEFIGDGIVVVFGAPLQRPDDARRAVACAVDMQLAMATVNDRNRQAGYPEVALGIGVNTGKMVVGNIGSKKRIKYGVVGRHVNLTSRIESYTVGGQIFISEGTLKECGDIVRIDSAMQVMPKGVQEPLTIYEVGGIAGDYQLFLPAKSEVEWILLTQQLPVQFTVLEGKHVGELRHNATIVKLALNMAEIMGEILPSRLANLRLSLYDYHERLITEDLYAKVLAHCSDFPPVFQVNFTALPPEAESFLAESLSSTRKN